MEKMTAKEAAALAVKALDSKMGVDIQLIEITDVSTLADYFLICTASSSTHVKTLCDAVEEAMDNGGRANAQPRRTPLRYVGADGLWLRRGACFHAGDARILQP